MKEATEPKRLNPEVRKRQILDVAADLFIERGFEAVEIPDIAERAGVSRPTVYRYFPSTEAMLSQLLDEALDRIWVRLRPLVEPSSGSAPGTNTQAIFAMLLDERRVLELLHSGGGPVFQERRRALLSERLAGQLRAQLPDEPPPYMLLILSVMLESMAYWAATDPQIDVAALSDTLSTFVRGGLASLADT